MLLLDFCFIRFKPSFSSSQLLFVNFVCFGLIVNCFLLSSSSQSFKTLVAKKKRLVVLFSHWLLHAYGIISISLLDKLELSLPLLVLVPGPTLFYIATAKFTEPSRILSEGGSGHWAPRAEEEERIFIVQPERFPFWLICCFKGCVNIVNMISAGSVPQFAAKLVYLNVCW